MRWLTLWISCRKLYNLISFAGLHFKDTVWACASSGRPPPVSLSLTPPTFSLSCCCWLGFPPKATTGHFPLLTHILKGFPGHMDYTLLLHFKFWWKWLYTNWNQSHFSENKAKPEEYLLIFFIAFTYIENTVLNFFCWLIQLDHIPLQKSYIQYIVK